MHQPPIVTRFAPSPTGRLHLGHAFSALFAWNAARQAGGRFLLRLEDIDPVRCRADFAQGIIEDLTWLGLDWDGPVRVQSAHLADYQTAIDQLAGDGLVYPCFCTRKDIAAEIKGSGHAPHGPDGPLYPGLCKHKSPSERHQRIAAGQPYALRLDAAAAAARVGRLTWTDQQAGTMGVQADLFGDVVLARKDTPASYHLAVTWDDALQGVTLVTRGVDLFAASHLHRVLQALLGLPVPTWLHHGLLTDETGRRYAKRDRALTLAALRDQGRSPAEIRAMVGLYTGQPSM